LSFRDSCGLVLGIVFLANGCARSPERVGVPEEIAAPSSWVYSSEAEENSGAVWWDSFVSQELEQVLNEAFLQNPDLLAMSARVESAAANVRLAGAGLYPTASAGLDAARRKQNFIGLPIPGSGGDVLSTHATTMGFTLSTVWEVDLWGRVRAAKRAAIAESQATVADFDMYRLSLAAQLTKAWIAAVAAEQQLELVKATAQSFSDTATKIDERYQQGLRPALDYELALNSAEGAKALVAERIQQRTQAIQQLQVLLGRYPSGRFELPSQLPLLAEPVAAGIPSSLLQRRPDLVAAERRLAAADQRVWEARAAFFPQISLSASTGTSSAELKDLFDTDFSVWGLAGNVAQPLLQGGRLRAGLDLSKARVKEVTYQYVSAVQQAFREVEFGLSSEGTLRERERRVVSAAAHSERALELANRRYESGLVELISVLESQRRSLSDATQVILVRQARLNNRIDLFVALGGAYENESTVSE
jgi:outer membrane protein, multidrug efflux system